MGGVSESDLDWLASIGADDDVIEAHLEGERKLCGWEERNFDLTRLEKFRQEGHEAHRSYRDRSVTTIQTYGRLGLAPEEPTTGFGKLIVTTLKVVIWGAVKSSLNGSGSSRSGPSPRPWSNTAGATWWRSRADSRSRHGREGET
jgi:hypothetical protein